ncbi:hypothetical protein MNBD_UNCLBAC01-1597 [hydrothermal vent metagenome]|uniref:Ferric uptake regulation protein FUR n=1 Tax=hydrothermal vent metagenome TaxID=652676 RepID=A0A3B1D2F7_9ZZZZ
MKQKILKEKLRFQEYLDKRKIKFTHGRQVVFDEIMQAHGHFSIEEFIKQCKNNKRQVSRATIYRTLRELLEACVIRETAYGEKHNHYEHLYDEEPHHHARCLRCSGVIEFPEMHEDRIYNTFLENKGFEILGHEMHFYGLCKNCK